MTSADERAEMRADLQLIQRVRLLIARAANSDSLAWWDDESLTGHARFILERTFPVAPAQAASSLALAAALARHEAVCPRDSLHLYRLDKDNREGLALRSQPTAPALVPAAPIASVDALRQQLLDLLGGPQAYKAVQRMSNHSMRIEIPPNPSGVEPLAHRAGTLAWAYLEGSPGQAVIPFCDQAL